MKALLIALSLFSTSAFADVYVNGYTRSDGQYVQPHYRSNPDNSRANNWSAPGNVNPHTGSVGGDNVYRQKSAFGTF